MNCNEFQYPIISVTLLSEDTDIVYHYPSTLQGIDTIALRTLASFTGAASPASTIYASLLKDGGTPLIMSDESPKLTNTLNTKQGGHFQKVTLEYTCSSLSCNTSQDLTAFHTQQRTLRQSSFSLLLDFFDGSQALVRCLPHGDGYLFSSKEQDGTITNTISITNLTGILPIVPTT